ncbi:MAG: 4Fe-4S dicluster domain-containing protein, partial [Clostridiales bacterium]|nr:4Fe-4S dicluster domain-containing protein [Clostridiales bacterium]
NDMECIRCGACIKACPAKALSYEFGLGAGAKKLQKQ